MTFQEPKRRLTVRHDGVILKEYPIEGARLTIGRRSGNDVQLDDPATSGAHAVIALEESEFLEGYRVPWLEDLGSTNGTLVNGARVTRSQLKPGDIIRIGHHELTYSEDGIMDSTVFLLSDS